MPRYSRTPFSPSIQQMLDFAAGTPSRPGMYGTFGCPVGGADGAVGSGMLQPPNPRPGPRGVSGYRAKGARGIRRFLGAILRARPRRIKARSAAARSPLLRDRLDLLDLGRV